MTPSNHAGGAGGGTAAAPWAGVVEEALTRHAGERGALLPVLHDIQDRTGYIPPEAQPRIAEALGLSRADVHGVVTFYHDFRSAKPGRRIVKLCRAEACQAMGSEALAERLRERAGTDFGGTSADGALTIESVYCLGNCACAPAVLVDGQLEGRVTGARIDGIVAEARSRS